MSGHVMYIIPTRYDFQTKRKADGERKDKDVD